MSAPRKETRLVVFTLLTLILLLNVFAFMAGFRNVCSGWFIVVYFFSFGLYLTIAVVKAIRHARSTDLAEKREFEDTFRKIT
ncbi:MAG: hypothetical protein ACYS47_01935 [Planctomycetota bacterium]|jgi:hypothetical protein